VDEPAVQNRALVASLFDEATQGISWREHRRNYNIIDLAQKGRAERKGDSFTRAVTRRKRGGNEAEREMCGKQ
jgi:hypothetical protein